MKRYSQRLIPALVFLSVFLSHFFSKNITSADSRWSIPTALSIVKERNTDLDEYKGLLEKNNYYFIKNINGHCYTFFPVGVSVIAAPFVYVIDRCGIDVIEIYEEVELFVACVIVAITAVFVYFISQFFLNRGFSLLVTFIFAFCTSAWSTASRALWQHGPSMLMLTITLFIILRAREKPWLVQLAGFPLAVSYVIRPTNSISILLLTIFIFIQYRRFFLPYTLWALTVTVPFTAFNLSLYHSVLPPYYMAGRLFSNPAFFEALIGNLISPARGLFVFSPIFLFSIVAILLKIKKRQFERLDYFLLGIILLHWISISSFWKWWGGHCIGPRFFSDMIPYLIYFLIAMFKMMSEIEMRALGKTVLFSISLGLLIYASFFIHYRSANSWEVCLWSSEPFDVDSNPARLWDWGDIQFLRGMK